MRSAGLDGISAGNYIRFLILLDFQLGGRMPDEDVSDILILGAGPAGAAAALFAAKKGLTTTVLERGPSPPSSGWIEWLNPAGRALLDGARPAAEGDSLGVIDRVRFVDVGGAREARAPLSKAVEVVDSSRLTAALVAGAKTAGATVLADAEVVDIEVQERSVRLATATARSASGRILIAADGCDSVVARRGEAGQERAGFKAAVCCECVDGRLPVRSLKASKEPVELTLLAASEDFSSFGYFVEVAGVRLVGLVSLPAAQEVGAAFDRALASWKEAGAVPSDINADGARAAIRSVPRGMALDLETHVGKNSLFVGDAGGFVAAVSHEGLYPAVASAKIAVDVCGEALGAPHAQDALIGFDERWRRELVDYLRLPNADLRFLIPLVFSNDKIAQKLADAFLLGENI
jgi:flavin-dependent dehydrogenase